MPGSGRARRCASITCMRTTISLDDDVLLAVQERARREKRTAGQVLSDLARQALTGQHRQSEDGGRQHHGFRPLPRRGSAVSNALIDRLREDDPE
ncbi:ribbon-helix-helix domain-containing protein [soil metagenome]